MAKGEFALIERYFRHCGAARDDLLLGIGDDAALLTPPVGMALAVTTDTLVAGVHFFPDGDYRALGWKVLAVNLSDLAAMGAEPAWATLALTLPHPDPALLTAFSEGFCALARHHRLALVGGDTTRGPLAFTVQLHGFVAPQRALRRDQARPGDLIYVTGSLGDAALALRQIEQWRSGSAPPPSDPALLERLHRPTPRLAEGAFCAAHHARCAIDLSDGLLADLGHICQRSGVGAEIDLQRLPLSPAVRREIAQNAAWELPLSGGDDYELCLTLPAAVAAPLLADYPPHLAPLTAIGEITDGDTIRCRHPDGGDFTPIESGYDHFR